LFVLAFGTNAIKIQGVIFGCEPGYFIVGKETVYFPVFYLADVAARCAYDVMMLFRDTFQLVLYVCGRELMAHDDFGVEQQFDGVVDGGAAYMEIVVFQLFPYRVERKE
jgi:hypothetical protein